MTHERFRPIPQPIKEPTSNNVQLSGFSNSPKAELSTRPRHRNFRRDPQRWQDTGGYPPISGGSHSPESNLRSIYEDYIRSMWPDLDEKEVQEIAQSTFKISWDSDELQRDKMEREFTRRIERNKGLRNYLARSASSRHER